MAAFVADCTQRVCSLGVLTAALVLLSAPAIRSDSECAEELSYESREEIPLRFRWNPADIFADREAFDAAVSAIDAAIPELESLNGTLGDSAEALTAALNAHFELKRMEEEVDVYVSLRMETDGSDPAVDAISGVASSLKTRVDEALSFVSLEIVALPQARLSALLADPRTEPYRHLIDNMVRTKAHVRSPEVEQLLAGAAQLRAGPKAIADELVFSDIVWPTVVDKDGNEVEAAPDSQAIHADSLDRDFRREGRRALLQTYEAYSNTLATSLATHVQGEVWVTKVRGYNSSLERALDEENIPVEVPRSLLEAVHDNFDVVHNYTALRRKALGVGTLHSYDMSVSMVPNVDKRYCFEEAWDMALTFWRETFGEEYAAVAEAAIANRWMDVFTHSGKNGGWRSWAAYGSHPYMLFNWKGTLEDVSSLIFEMGQVVNMNLTNTHQPFHYSDTSLLVADVASTTSRILFMDWVMEHSQDPQERVAVLSEAVELVVGDFVYHTLFHEVEDEIYIEAENGGPLTKDTMGAKYLDLYRAYFGPDLTLNASDGSYIQRVHLFYTYNIWAIATSYAASEAIASRFRNGEEGAVDDFLAMLKLGSSVYPMEALRVAGVDFQDPSVVGTVMSRLQNLTMELGSMIDGA